MERKIVVLSGVFIICLLAAGSGADEPERVMNFLAVMDLNCGKVVGKDECAVLTDLVISELVKTGKYTVIDRANRDKILEEVGFQQTGCVDESCSVEAGRMLGVGKIVVGKVTKFGTTYIVSLQLINVQTGAVEIAAEETCKCELDGLIQSVRNAARKLMGQAPIHTTSTISSSSAPGAPPPADIGKMVHVPAGKFLMGIKESERKILIEENKEILTETYVGLGIIIEKENPENYIKIVRVMPGSPTLDYGIEEGDYILQINGKSTKLMTIKDFADVSKGKEGTIAKLKIRKKDSGKTKNIKVRRAKVVFLDPEYFAEEVPQHDVLLDGFYIDKYEVTVDQYKACVNAGKCKKPRTGGNYNWGVSGRANHPINDVDWNDATAYCEYAGKRLPTEAEWEKAARGTDGRLFPWGNNWNPRNANYCDSSCRSDWADKSYNDGYSTTSPVGSFPGGASSYGAMDMAGNVWEWCSDWYDKKYYSNSPNRNPTGPASGKSRVLRGGSWSSYPYHSRSSYRGRTDPAGRFSSYGFRCARTP